MDNIKKSAKQIITLVGTEFKKLFSATIIIVTVILIIGAVCFIAYPIETSMQTKYKDDWKQFMQSHIESDEYSFEQNKDEMSAEIKEYHAAKLAIDKYRCENNLKPYDDNSLANYIMLTNYTFPLFMIVMLVISSKIITDEYKNKTITNLLTLPIKRWKILTAKLLTILIVAIGIALSVFLLSFLVGGMLYGFDSASATYVGYSGGQVVAMNIVARAFLQTLLNIVGLMFGAIVACLLGVACKSILVALLGSCSFYGLGAFILSADMNLNTFKFLPIFHMDFTRYLILDIMPFTNVTIGFSLLILGLFAVPLLALTYFAFNKQDV